jgi:epoxide hydrolase-like predicted phosphatase
MTRPYRCLLVDYGGVMTTSMSVSFGAFCVAAGVSPERLKDVLAAAYSVAEEAAVPASDLHDLVAGVETGRIEPEEFDRRLAEALSIGLDRPIGSANLTARLFAELRPDDRMRRAVRSARSQGVRTALISNTWGVTPPREVDGMFDTVVLSGREALRKPQPEIYLLAAQRLLVEPEACVFVDDVPANVEGARAVGMVGLLHKHPDITIPKLEELFGIPLSEATRLSSEDR